jgi:endonuclease-3
MTPEARMAIFRRLQKANPRPKTELVYRSTFQLLVTVILSAQATDVSVNKATRPLFKIANTPEGLLELGETELKKYIRTIGLYNTKAKNILRTCRILLDEYGGEVPSDRKALEALPGVGRKTANIVLNIAFGNRPSPSIRMCSAWPIAPDSRRARPRAPSRTRWSPARRNASSTMPITG